MSDNIEEKKPSDIVGTNKEYKRVEYTLPEQHSSKGLEPIIPASTGNNKNGRTIGSMGSRQEKSMFDINSIGKQPHKLSDDIVTPASRIEKENPIIAEKENRSFKDDIVIPQQSDREKKYNELQQDITRLSMKRDLNVKTEQQYEAKKEDKVDIKQNQVKKTELFLEEKKHRVKQESDIFKDMNHDRKSSVEIEPSNNTYVKKENDTQVLSDHLNKKEIDETIIGSNLSKLEQEISPKSNEKKSEVLISSSDDRKEKTEKAYDPAITEKKIDKNIVNVDTGTEKTEIRENIINKNTPKPDNEVSAFSKNESRDDKDVYETTGDVNFINLQNNEKTWEHNTTDLSSPKQSDHDPKRSNIDLPNNRNDKTGLLGDEEYTLDYYATKPKSAIQEHNINSTDNVKEKSFGDSTPNFHNSSATIDSISNYLIDDIDLQSSLDKRDGRDINNYTDYSPVPASKPQTIITKKSVKPIVNLSYSNVLDEFNNALLNGAKEGYSDDNTPKNPIAPSSAPGKTKFDSNSIINGVVNYGNEEDHTNSGITLNARPVKTQDIKNKVLASPNNVDDRISEDRSDLSKIALSEDKINYGNEEDHTVRGIIDTARPYKSGDTLLSFDKDGKEVKTQIVPQPNNVDDRISEDRSKLDKYTLESGKIDINKKIDFNTRTLGPVGRENKNSNDSGDIIEPIVITKTETEDESIAYRPQRQDDFWQKIRGINTATLASFLRPIGNIRKFVNNTRKGSGDLDSVALNALMPFTNEIPDNVFGRNIEGFKQIFNGSKAIIPLTPEVFGQEFTAGNLKDDLVNYTRHAIINGFRVIANNIVDNLWIQGENEQGDRTQALNVIKQSSPEAAKIIEKSTPTEPPYTGALTKSSQSQDVRGQINSDIGILQGGYSNASIKNSIANKYKDFESYREMLKIQLARKSFASKIKGAFSSDENNKDLIKEYNRSSPTTPLEIQRQKMIGQMIDFESRIFENDGKTNVMMGLESAASKNQLFSRSTYSITNNLFSSDDDKSFSKTINYGDNDIYEVHFKQSQIKDYGMKVSDRSLRQNFKNVFKKSDKFSIYDGSEKDLNFSNLDLTGESKFKTSITTNNNYRAIDNKTIDYKGFLLEDDKKDPHILNAYSQGKSKDEIIITDRGTKELVYKKLLEDSPDDTLFFNDMPWATKGEQIKNRELSNNSKFSSIKSESGMFKSTEDNETYNLSGLTHVEYETKITKITSNNSIYNKEKYTNDIRSAKDIWAKYAENYKLEKWQTDSIDRSVGIFKWNLSTAQQLLQKGNTNIYSSYNYKDINLNNTKLLFDIIGNASLNNIVSEEKIKNYYNLTLPSDYTIKANINPLIKDVLFDKIHDGTIIDDQLKYIKNKNIYKNTKNYQDTIDSNIENVNDFRYQKNIFDNIEKNIEVRQSIQEDANISGAVNSLISKLRTNHILSNESVVPHTDGKLPLKIKDYHKEQENFEKEIFVKDRHNLATKEGKDAWWKKSLFNKLTGDKSGADNQDIGYLVITTNPQVGMTKTPVLSDIQLKADFNESDSLQDTVLFRIPLQFNPEITGESIQANWSNHTGFGRTSEFYIWNNTSSRQISFKTTYLALDGTPSAESAYTTTSTDQYSVESFRRLPAEKKLSKNPAMVRDNSSFSGWSPIFLHRTMEKYRSLVYPINLSDPNLSSPPIIIIDFNGMFKRFTKHSKDFDSRWICENVSIDPLTQMGFTTENFPMGFEVNLTLREILNDWGDYQDIKSNFMDNVNRFHGLRKF